MPDVTAGPDGYDAMAAEIMNKPWDGLESLPADIAAALRQVAADARAAQREALTSIRLRAGYILGHCRGEAEMKAEATAIIAILDAGDPPLAIRKGKVPDDNQS